MNGYNRVVIEVLGALLIALLSHFLTSAATAAPVAALDNRISIVEASHSTLLKATNERLDRIERKLDDLFKHQ